jgi:phenylacetate-CoA ligase
VLWPAIPAPGGAETLALLQQLEQSQWLPPERLLELQMRQLDQLARHACSSVALYSERWQGVYDPAHPFTPESFARLPLLPRRELQTRYDALKTSALPAQHLPTAETRTSGSTGAPVRVLKTRVTELLWKAFTLRDHLWHRRDMLGKLAAIRHGVTEGESDNWGTATRGLVETGPVAVLHIRSDTDTQLGWLEKQQPMYLLAYPSIVCDLAKACIARGLRMPRLREVRTIGESLDPQIRELCRDAWNARLVDVYSADEVGYIALQCPAGEHYHVQSEGVLVEVLNDFGRPCAPGEVGRVVITDLHNFATPLVRYDIGDFAEVGERCSCGRGLPVLRRILGRVRNLLLTSSGQRYWPTFGMRKLTAIPKILQYQFVQKQLDLLEARVVASAPLAPAEEETLTRHILSCVPSGFRLRIEYRDAIPRGTGGKYEEFVSEVDAARS